MSRKVLAIPRKLRCEAIGLWTMSGAWSSHNLTDGRVPKYIVEEFAGAEKAVRSLVQSGLWTEQGDDYLFHGWDERNPKREEVLEKRAQNAERIRLWREKQRLGDSVGDDVGNAVTNTGETPPPTLPVPTRPDPKKRTPSATAVAGLFDEFWEHYPRKADRGHALKAYRVAVKRADAETLLAAVQRFAAAVKGSDPKFIPYGATWLNGDRWADDLEAEPSSPWDEDGPDAWMQP